MGAFRTRVRARIQREKDVERYLVRQVRQLGGRAYKFTSPGRAGVPDRLIVWPGGRVCFVEVKAYDRPLSRLQVSAIRELKALGAVVVVVRSYDAVNALLSAFRRP